jgi:hypothetical protein
MARRGKVENPLGPARRLVAHPQVHQLGQRRDQPQRQVRVPVAGRALERDPQVVVVRQGALDPGPLVRAVQTAGRVLGEVGEVPGVPAADRVVGARFAQPLPPVRAQRLQHVVARPAGSSRRRHHRLVDESGQQIERVVLGGPRIGTHSVHPGQVGAAREHRQPRERSLLRLGQQPVGPVDGRGEALMPGQRRARATRQQPTTVELARYLRGTHRPHPRRGQLDRQRQPVEPPADLGDGALFLPIGGEVWPVGAGALDEQGARVLGWQRRHRPALLAVHAERLPAGGQHRHRWAQPHHLVDQPCGRIQDVLAVVEHEQQSPVREVLDHGLLDREALALPHAQRHGHRVSDRAARAERGELAEPGAVGEPGPLPVGDRHGEPGLADSADSAERHQRRAGQRGDHVRDLLGTANQRGGPPRQVAPGRRGDERRIVPQYPAVHRLRGLRGLDRQLVVEPAAQLVVGGKGVGLPARAIQRAHQLGDRPFSGGKAADQRLGLGGRLVVATQVQQSVDPFLGGGEAQLGQPRGLGAREVEVGELREGLTPPQAEPSLQQVERLLVVTGRGQSSRLRHEPLELGSVELVVGDVQQVARRPVPQPARRSEHRAQPREVGAQRADRAGWWLVAPQRVDQPVDRYHGAAVHEQGGKQGSRFRAADGDRRAVALDPQRPQDAKAHGHLRTSGRLQSDCNHFGRQ